ncbi:hypothetical protein H4S01_001177 [Coemansia sp. RSA 2610]|nr:hypothetical protein IWW54_000848 [Coemansia sp. RSA 2705]KAJ2321418.1 hypothetical protein IWW52_000760 [Coemansia sp. RSA 2704]KAJ2369149.1 hypothetical protein H4S01_001177 [Coemansia sp. RSA 2610]
MGPTQAKDDARPAASVRRFREVHYHRFQLGTRSNIHGTCLLRSHLPVRLPRPHAMHLIYPHPPPGVGYRRGVLPPWQEAQDQAAFARIALEHARATVREIKDERRRVAQWLATQRAIARTHVVVATQSRLLFFVAGFGYWNVLDIDLCLQNEACVGVKAFEVHIAEPEPLRAEPDGHEDDPETIDQHQLPVMVIALTTYVKRAGETNNGVVDESGSYRLYALGAESLPPLSSDFIEKHALRAEKKSDSDAELPRSDSLAEPQKSTSVPRASSQPAGPPTADPLVAPRRCMSETQPPAQESLAETGDGEANLQQPQTNLIRDLPVNSYAYLEERLFSLTVSEGMLSLDLDYLPFRISQDVTDGMPPVLLVSGNDNRVHRYALGRGQIVEIEPLLCPKTDVALTFTAFDARVIGPYHVQVTAHQEFAVALQASRALTASEAAEAACVGSGDPLRLRKLLVADEEIYDAAPVLITIFTPESNRIDRTAFDYIITHRLGARGSAARLMAGDVYDAEWPLGTMGEFPGPAISSSSSSSSASDQPPRVHVLIGFVGEDAVIYHDVPIAGLDPVPMLVGGAAGRVPSNAAHIAGRLRGRGGVFSLPGSSKEGLITSVHFDDLDFDGTKEIIVGTVSGAVLIYKAVERGYVLVWKRRFPAPAYGIFSTDINCDGANELVVVTLLGVHILQPNLAHVRAKLLRQLVLAAHQSESESGSEPNPKAGSEREAV